MAQAAVERLRPDVRLAQVYAGHAEPVYALIAGPTPEFLLSGSGDGFVGLWNTSSGAFERPLANLPASIYSLCLIETRSLLFVGLQNGQLHLIDLERRRALRNWSLSGSGIFSLMATHDGASVFAGDGSGRLHEVRLEPGEEPGEVVRTTTLAGNALRCLALSPCGSLLAAASSDCNVYEWDAANGSPASEISGAHGNSVFTAIYAGRDTLLSGGRDALLKRWKRQPGNLFWEMTDEIPAHNFTVNSLALSPDGSLLATASRDKTIKLWDAASLALLKVIDLEKFPGGHTHSVNTLHWAASGLLFSAGDDRRILAWEVEW